MKHLKSNMDRFIAAQQIEQMTVSDYLKSNMDRFIVKAQKRKNGLKKFKIQYG